MILEVGAFHFHAPGFPVIQYADLKMGLIEWGERSAIPSGKPKLWSLGVPSASLLESKARDSSSGQFAD